LRELSPGVVVERLKDTVADNDLARLRLRRKPGGRIQRITDEADGAGRSVRGCFSIVGASSLLCRITARRSAPCLAIIAAALPCPWG
jgi:hypothetical protein